VDFQNNLDKLMKEAQKMQEKMQSAQEELANLIVTGESGAGAVKVDMNGRHDVKRVDITDEKLLDPDEKDILEDLIAAAINDAVRKIEKESRGKISDLTKGLDLPPDFKLPGTDRE